MSWFIAANCAATDDVEEDEEEEVAPPPPLPRPLEEDLKGIAHGYKENSRFALLLCNLTK